MIIRCFGADEKLRTAQVSSTVAKEDHGHNGRLLGEASNVTSREREHEGKCWGNCHDEPETCQTGEFIRVGEKLDHEDTGESHDVCQDEGDVA